MGTDYFSTLAEKILRRATRRQMLQGAGLLAAAGWLFPKADVTASAEQQRERGNSIYDSIGVRPIINARGAITIVGATRTLPEVKRAMEEAARQHVQLDELMDGVGRRLAELTGAEWGMVTAGASAALTVATAACIAGGDPDKLARLPDLSGLKNEVIMPAYSRTVYDFGARVTGARIVEVTSRHELDAALGLRTAMVMVHGKGPLPLNEIASATKPRGIPILVDAASDGPIVPNPYLSDGADLVAYSGGKRLRGPQCAGLLIGRKDLIQAAWFSSAPHHGFGRGFKVGREEIMGMLAAVEMFMKRNPEEEWRAWMSLLGHIARRLETRPGVTTDFDKTQAQGPSTRTPSLRIDWDTKRIPLSGEDVTNALWEGDPRIAVSGAGSFLPFPPNIEPNIEIVPFSLEAGEERLIADRLVAVFSNPPHTPLRTDAPAFDVTGQWDAELTFAASTARQSFAFEQKGSALVGTHEASYASRDLIGTLHGSDIFIRSSYTDHGMRLNFTFSGTVSGDTMRGHVSLSEYGTAQWTAKRRSYHMKGSSVNG
jgi:L-seryl-tRNA(Ser) seleniumtransferase